MLLIDFGKQLERIIERHDVCVRHLRHGDRSIQLDLVLRPTLCRAAVSRVVHQDLAHESCGHGDKMSAILCLKWAASDEPQIGFVD